MTQSVIIVGASHAAAQTCVSLRQGGWEGAITVIGEESVLPYHRPPLSKDFLSGHMDVEDILIRPAESYASAFITIRLGERVEAINRTFKTVLTNSGEELSYDKLVLTTGARVRKLPVKGEDLEGVFYLRDMSDAAKIKERAVSAKSVVIIGGGYIGLEAAASLRRLGLGVTVLEAMPRVLQRVTAPQLSEFYKRIHREEGVVIAAHINGSPKPYDSVPWFWSDQFDLKLQIAGLSNGYDDVVIRGDIDKGRSFAAYYFKGIRFIAVDAVNAPRDFMFGKMSLKKGVNLDKVKLANVSIALKETVVL